MKPRSYPKYDLSNSIEVARRLHQHGGRASALELAALLNYGGTNNGAYLNRMAAARAFGLVEGEGKGATINVSKRALNILQPDYPVTEERARIDAFTSVPLYAEFLNRYEGQPLPDKPGMKNALMDMGIPAKTADLALSRLLASADQAGLFNVAPNKLIRPTLILAPTATASADAPPPREDDEPQERSKLIEALLEELPAGHDWNEAGLVDWLEFFGRALRIHYRLPPTGAGSRK